MKNLIMLIAVTFALGLNNALADESYECEFSGPNYLLNIQNDGTITLSNRFISYECKKGEVPFPGTVVTLTKIFCESGFNSVSYYVNENSEGNVFLTKNFLFSKDILCTRK